MFAASAAALLLLASAGSVASATLAGGGSKAHCRVPRVVGLSLGAAEKKLRRGGCRVGAVQRRVSTLPAANRVLGQKPSSGRRIGVGRRVKLVVGKGPKTALLPHLLGKIVPQRLPPYIAYDPPAGGIWLIKPDGSDAHQVGPPNASHPVWSPDATKILYQAPAPPNEQGDNTDTYVMNADGSGQHLIMVSAGCGGETCWFDSDFHWSPDGKQIAFVNSDVGLLIANADDSDQHLVGVGGEASFSPDGNYLVVDSNTLPGAKSGLFVTSPDGTGAFLRQITFGGGVDDPSWSPVVSTRIVYGCLLDHAICELTPARDGGAVWLQGIPTKQRILYMNKNQTLLHPTWNANGTKILVTLEQAKNEPAQIALLSPSGRHPVKTGILLAPGTYPDW